MGEITKIIEHLRDEGKCAFVSKNTKVRFRGWPWQATMYVLNMDCPDGDCCVYSMGVTYEQVTKVVKDLLKKDAPYELY